MKTRRKCYPFLLLLRLFGATELGDSGQLTPPRLDDLVTVLDSALPDQLFRGLDREIMAMSSFDTNEWTASTKKIRWRKVLLSGGGSSRSLLPSTITHTSNSGDEASSSKSSSSSGSRDHLGTPAAAARWRVEQVVDYIAALANAERRRRRRQHTAAAAAEATAAVSTASVEGKKGGDMNASLSAAQAITADHDNFTDDFFLDDVFTGAEWWPQVNNA
jgi:hypothetical protein